MASLVAALCNGKAFCRFVPLPNAMERVFIICDSLFNAVGRGFEGKLRALISGLQRPAMA